MNMEVMSEVVTLTARSGFSDKSIIEGLEAGSLTHQFLLLPMGGRRVEPGRRMGLYFKASG